MSCKTNCLLWDEFWDFSEGHWAFPTFVCFVLSLHLVIVLWEMQQTTRKNQEHRVCFCLESDVRVPLGFFTSRTLSKEHSTGKIMMSLWMPCSFPQKKRTSSRNSRRKTWLGWSYGAVKAAEAKGLHLSQGLFGGHHHALFIWSSKHRFKVPHLNNFARNEVGLASCLWKAVEQMF